MERVIVGLTGLLSVWSVCSLLSEEHALLVLAAAGACVWAAWQRSVVGRTSERMVAAYDCESACQNADQYHYYRTQDGRPAAPKFSVQAVPAARQQLPQAAAQQWRQPVAVARGRSGWRVRRSAETGTLDVEKAAQSTVNVSAKFTGEQTNMIYRLAAEKIVSANKDLVVPGFRKGDKVPFAILEDFLSKSRIKSVAVANLTEQALKQAETEGHHLIGEPQFDESGETAIIESFSPGEPIKYSFKCDVWPELTWKKEFSEVEIEVEEMEADESRVQQLMQNIAMRNVVLEDFPDDHVAAMGDVVVGNMTGYARTSSGSKGEALPAVASGDGVEIILEEGRFMPGLAEGLVGSKKGDTREIEINFPEQASKNLPETLAGKGAIFDIQVLAVKNRIIPPLDDTLANAIKPGLTFAELDSEVREEVKKEGNSSLMGAKNKAIENALIDMVDCEMPETLVDKEATQRFAQFCSAQRESGMPDEEVKKMVTKEGFEKYKKVARKSIIPALKAEIIIEDIIKNQGISVDSIDIEQQFNLLIAQAEQKGQAVEDKEGLKEEISMKLKRQAVLDWVADKITIHTVEPKEIPQSK